MNLCVQFKQYFWPSPAQHVKECKVEECKGTVVGIINICSAFVNSSRIESVSKTLMCENCSDRTQHDNLLSTSVLLSIYQLSLTYLICHLERRWIREMPHFAQGPRYHLHSSPRPRDSV